MLKSPKETFERLRNLGKNIIPKAGRIILIPKDVFKVACKNRDYHGDTNVSIVFRPAIFGQGGKVVRKGVNEETCSCGIIYKQES